MFNTTTKEQLKHRKLFCPLIFITKSTCASSDLLPSCYNHDLSIPKTIPCVSPNYVLYVLLESESGQFKV